LFKKKIVHRQQELGLKYRNPMYANFNYGNGKGNVNNTTGVKDSLDSFK
jgi:hypothetical protein